MDGAAGSALQLCEEESTVSSSTSATLEVAIEADWVVFEVAIEVDTPPEVLESAFSPLSVDF